MRSFYQEEMSDKTNKPKRNLSMRVKILASQVIQIKDRQFLSEITSPFLKADKNMFQAKTWERYYQNEHHCTVIRPIQSTLDVWISYSRKYTTDRQFQNYRLQRLV